MPAAYDSKHCIGMFKTDGSSHILPFTQSGDKFILTTAITEVNAAAASVTPTLLTLTGVPPGFNVQALVRMAAVSATPGDTLLAYPYCSTSSVAIYLTCQVNGIAVTSDEVPVLTNTTAQIYHNSTGTVTESLFVNGWIFERGRNQ